MKPLHKTMALGLSLLISASWQGQARAEDLKQTTLSLLPWRNLALVLGAKERKLNVSLSGFVSDNVRLAGSFSTPLDEETRLSGVLSGPTRQPSFSGSVYLGYDTTNPATEKVLSARPTEAAEMLQRCQELSLDPSGDGAHCTPERLAAEQTQLKKSAYTHVIPAYLQDGRRYYSVGVELAASFDRTDAYRKDVAGTKESLTAYNVQAGVSGTLFPTYWSALSARVGVEHSQSPDLTKVNRCVSQMSSESQVAGSSCKDTFVFAEDPQPNTAGYIRLGGQLLFRRAFGQVVPGLELRANWEGLGRGATFDGRVAVFVAPPIGPAVLRVGVGVDLSVAIQDLPDQSYKSGELRYVTPVGFIGSGF